MSLSRRRRTRTNTKSSARRAIQKVRPPAGERWRRGNTGENAYSRCAEPDPITFLLHRTRSASRNPVYLQPTPLLLSGGPQSSGDSAQKERFLAESLRTPLLPSERRSRRSSSVRKSWQKVDWRGQTPHPPKCKPPCGKTVAVD